jgi:phytoene dehydrogenase-like protein
MPVYDVAIVGAGHNALISACYLARAGLNVLVLERREVIGGAVCTEEMFGGYRMDVGSSVHIMFKSTPISEELRLEDYGLEYREMDPWAFYPVPESDKSISFYRSVERTCESIEKISRRDAFAYEAFMEKWQRINEGVWDAFLTPPTPGNIMGSLIKNNLANPKHLKSFADPDTTRQLMTSYGRLINENFESEPVRAALMWWAAQSGPPPDELATGDLLGWMAMIHKHGAWRAKGGSGMLTQALGKAFKALGGTLLTEAEVQKVSKGPKADLEGPRFQLTTAQGRFHSRGVLFGCHVQSALLDVLDDNLLDPDLPRRLRHLNVGNGFGMIVRHAVSELPRYAGQKFDSHGVGPCHNAMQLLCPSTNALKRAVAQFRAGQTPDYPLVVGMTFSALDPSLAPEGKHTLFTWAQYHPYELSSGKSWDRVAEDEADKIYDVVCQYAPNMEGKIIDRYIQTPLEIERKLALPRGNVMHLEMSFDQMFGFRPLPELSGYRTPMPGVYLTGASTHPGGGVFGASGRSAAQVVLQDFRKRVL